MKRTARRFLIANRVLAIVFFVIIVVCSIAMMVAGPITMAKGDFNGNEDQVAIAITGLMLLIYGITILVVATPFMIVSIIFGSLGLRAIHNATTRSEARKYAILSIISGAFAGIFGIPAGIIMLCMHDEDYQRQI